MKNTFTLLMLFVLKTIVAQNDTAKYYNQTLSRNNLSVELGGKALLYSVGYERTVYTSKKILLTGNLNMSYEPFVGFEGIILPLGFNMLMGEKKNKFLLGLFTTNGIDFNPYPKTKKERKDYKASPEYQSDRYSPPYRLFYIVPSIGYRRYLKNGNSISIEYNHIMYNLYGKLFVTYNGLGPWGSVKYNFDF